MSLTSSSVIYGAIVFTLISVSFVFLLLYKYVKYRKSKIVNIHKRYEKLQTLEAEQFIKEDISNIDSFWEYCYDNYCGISLFVILTMLVMIFLDMIVGGCVYDTRHEEPIYYQMMITKKATIEDSLVVTTDIVNTQLYESAIAFNTELVEYQQCSINPNYKYNFTGNCDWFAIEPIKLK